LGFTSNYGHRGGGKREAKPRPLDVKTPRKEERGGSRTTGSSPIIGGCHRWKDDWERPLKEGFAPREYEGGGGTLPKPTRDQGVRS